MKKILLILILVVLTLSAYSQTVIKHISNSSNTSGHITTIDNPNTNNKSNAVLIVTQNYGVYNVHEIGVWYSGGKWKIFNQNRKAMPLNNQFNILVLPKGSKSYVHTTTGGNTSGHITTLNHNAVNGKSNALVFVTQNYGKYNTSVVGVWYNGGKWKIYNEDRKPMPIGTKFNVYTVNEGTINSGRIRGTAFKHTNQSSGHISRMNNASAKDKNSQLFITQNWKDTYNAHTTGVWYSSGKWTAYNQDRQTLANNVRFNVLAVKSSNTQTGSEILNEDCLSFNPNNIEIENNRIVDGSHWLFAFPNYEEAKKAYNVIKQYGINQTCFVGRPDPSFSYLLKNGSSPTGAISGEDCIGFDPNKLYLKQEGSQYLMTDGRSRMFMFPNKAEAETALAMIKKYGFTQTCYIGRPNASLQYMRR